MIDTSPIGAAFAPRPGPSDSGSAAAAPATLVGRELEHFRDFQAANALYSRVFGYDEPGFTLNPNLLSSLRDYGGSVVGVFEPGDELIGFAYGFAGRDASGSDFHYSQSAVVDPAYQGRGVGRELKQLQRRVALRWGHRRMRWAFDPILTRNGHFNFSTLGAIGITYLTDYYDRPSTDRIVVEWELAEPVDPYREQRRAVAPRFAGVRWAEPVEQADGAVWVPLPTGAELAASIDTLRGELADALQAVLADGRVLVDCRRIDPSTVAYLAVPRVISTAAPDDAAHSEEHA